MTTEDQYREIQISMEEAQHSINLQDALQRLHTHADFQQIVLSGYFEVQAINLVSMVGQHQMQSAEHQTAIKNDMLAISGLKEYFRMLNVQGNRARQAIKDSQEALHEMDEEAAADSAEIN